VRRQLCCFSHLVYNILKLCYATTDNRHKKLSIYANGAKQLNPENLCLCNSPDHFPKKEWMEYGAILYLRQGGNKISIRCDAFDYAEGFRLYSVSVSREETFAEPAPLG